MDVPALPFGSGPGRRETLALYARHVGDDESLVDTGAAKARSLDKLMLDAFVERHGSAEARRLKRVHGQMFLEADWLATDRALAYVSPVLGSMFRWEWNEVVSIRLQRRRWKFRRVHVETSDREFEMSTGAAAAANLLTIANHFLQR